MTIIAKLDSGLQTYIGRSPGHVFRRRESQPSRLLADGGKLRRSHSLCRCSHSHFSGHECTQKDITFCVWKARGYTSSRASVVSLLEFFDFHATPSSNTLPSRRKFAFVTYIDKSASANRHTVIHLNARKSKGWMYWKARSSSLWSFLAA